MGNRVYLELRGSDLPFLAEEDEEAVVRLTCKNGLPLFWLALLREENLAGEWEAGLRAGLADPEETHVPPLRLGWREARGNAAAAQDRADVLLPGLAPPLQEWLAGLDRLAGQGPAQELRLDLAEYTNFHDGADSFLAELRHGVRLWHGPDRPESPVITDAGRELTGVDDRTDQPFPRAMPEWSPGRPVPGSPREGRDGPSRRGWRQQAAEWGMVLLCSAVIMGAAWLGHAALGPVGWWVGGGLGLILFSVVAWRWVISTDAG